MSIKMDCILKFRRAFSHPVAFNGTLLAFDGCNYRRTHGAPHRLKQDPVRITPYNEAPVNVRMAIQNQCSTQTTRQLRETRRT